MATILDLATVAGSALTSGDYFVVNDSGTDKKMAATDAALVALANTFTATQTVSHLVVNSCNLRMGSVALANDAFSAISSILSGSMSSVNGILLIHNTSNGASAIFSCRGGANAVQEIADPATVFSPTRGTASSVNVYYSSGYGVQNKTGSTANLIMLYVGT